MTTKLDCRRCGQPMEIDGAAGQEFACPTCGMSSWLENPPPIPVKPQPIRVVITDVQISTITLVGLLVQLAVAAVPAMIVLAVTVGLGLFLAGLMGLALR